MTSTKVPQSVEVPLAELAELAVDCWRFERWVGGLAAEGANAHARLAARRLSKFLEERGLKALDVTGAEYEPGLAVEVVEVLRDGRAEDGREVVDETVAPIVTWRGTVIRHGQVVVRRRA